jgi:hypothetical protein
VLSQSMRSHRENQGDRNGPTCKHRANTTARHADTRWTTACVSPQKAQLLSTSCYTAPQGIPGSNPGGPTKLTLQNRYSISFGAIRRMLIVSWLRAPRDSTSLG